MVALGWVVGDLLPHLVGDLVEDLPFALSVAMVYQVASLQDQRRLKGHDRFHDVPMDVVLVAGIAIGDEAKQGIRRHLRVVLGQRVWRSCSRRCLRAGGCQQHGQGGEDERTPTVHWDLLCGHQSNPLDGTRNRFPGLRCFQLVVTCQ